MKFLPANSLHMSQCSIFSLKYKLLKGQKYTPEGHNKQNKFPTPGIEPGPAGWEPAILAPRPCRIGVKEDFTDFFNKF